MAGSSPAIRLTETKRTFMDAFNNEQQDYRDAQSLAEVRAIQRNLAGAEAAYLEAGISTLNKTGAAVEAAFAAAKKANDEVDKARKGAVALAQRIAKVATAVGAVKDLVKKAK